MNREVAKLMRDKENIALKLKTNLHSNFAMTFVFFGLSFSAIFFLSWQNCHVKKQLGGLAKK
jgi:hypothetical protein